MEYIKYCYTDMYGIIKLKYTFNLVGIYIYKVLNMKYNNILGRIWKGLKHEPLFNKIIIFNNHSIVRIFRVIGVISVLTVLLRNIYYYF